MLTDEMVHRITPEKNGEPISVAEVSKKGKSKHTPCRWPESLLFPCLHRQLDPSTTKGMGRSQGHRLSPPASDLGTVNRSYCPRCLSRLPGGLAKKRPAFLTSKAVKYHWPLCSDSQHLGTKGRYSHELEQGPLFPARRLRLIVKENV